MSRAILIRNGRIMDPAVNADYVGDLFIQNGVIAEKPDPMPDDTQQINAQNLIVAPAFWDLHVHLREPGGEEAETIESGTRAAARGGFGTIVAMPNTTPPMDTPARIHDVRQKAAAGGWAQVWPTGTITTSRSGRCLSDFAALREAGVCALTDDGRTVPDEALMREAMRKAADLGMLIMDHAQDPEAENIGVMHEGQFSRLWELPGIPAQAEAFIVERDLRLAEETGCRIHIQHVSAARSCELLRSARQRGIAVTAEVTPHHLALCDGDIDPHDANYKMNPPLRSAEDRSAILEAVCDGTIIALATDHAPHTTQSKLKGFLAAPFGVVGLETAIGVTHQVLVAPKRMSLMQWIKLWTLGPAQVLQLPPPSLQNGEPADITLLDLSHDWVVEPSEFWSRSRNTPFRGWRLRARAVCTIHSGKIVWRASMGA